MHMNNTRTATWVLIVLLIIAGGAYVYNRNKTTNVVVTPGTTTSTGSTTTPTPTVTVAMNYYCQDGKTITATYTNNSASLKLSDGRTLTLAQTVSGSGVRYESGSIAFVSKGNNAILTENGTNTYDNCVGGTRTSSGTSYTFTDASKLFSFTYPGVGTLSSTSGYDVNWKNNTTTLGMLLAQVSFPSSLQPKTNFGDSRFTVGTSSDVTAVKNCLTENTGGSSKGTLFTINGVQYTKLTASDAGAGNLYDTTSYRTLRNSQCYAIEYTIHSTQLGNYPVSAGIKAYDKVAATNMFESIVKSFKFI
jgi:membrane-bound inhibitor of C-type lysozyme